MNKSEEICRLMNLPWHEVRKGSHQIDYNYVCTCGLAGNYKQSLEQHAKNNNPDFTTDSGRVQLLREMRKREDKDQFLAYTGFYLQDGHDNDNWLDILTEPDLLIDACLEFLRNK